jgi:hypothetical protein
MIYRMLNAFFATMWASNNEDGGPTKVYFISDEHEYDPTYKNIPIPEGAFFLAEWERNGQKKLRIQYEGEYISDYEGDPFAPVKVPWIWVGVKETETDLTHTFNKFLVAGNILYPEFIDMLVPDGKVIYIDSKSLKETEFPEDGLLIEADDSVRES